MQHKDRELFVRGKYPIGESWRWRSIAFRTLFFVILFIILFAIAGRNQGDSCEDGQRPRVVAAARVVEVSRLDGYGVIHGAMPDFLNDQPEGTRKG